MADEKDNDATGGELTPEKAPAKRRRAHEKPERQQMLAMMLATGKFTTKQICSLLNVTPATIRTLRDSPLFRTQIQKYQQHVFDSIVDAAVADLLADAPDNVAFIKDVRAGRIEDHPQALNVRMRAAETLLERQIPKRERTGDAGVRIVINAETKERFQTTFKELEALEDMPE